MKSPKADPNQLALDMRNSRIKEFNDAVTRLLQLKNEITSFDFVLGQLNPEHQAYDFGRDGFFGTTIDGSVDRPLIAVAPPSNVSAPITAADAPTNAVPKERATKGTVSRGKATPKGKNAKPKKISERAKVAASVIHGEAAVASKPSKPEPAASTRSRRKANNPNIKDRDSREILSAYFKGKNPQQEITNILRGMAEPVTADTVGDFFRKIHPINLEQAPALKALFKSRIQAQIAALITKKIASGVSITSDDGKRTLRHYLLAGKSGKTTNAEPKTDDSDTQKAGANSTASEASTEIPATV